MTTNEQLTTEQTENEHVYNIDLPYISIDYCKFCKRFYNGDFGQSYLDACDPCININSTKDIDYALGKLDGCKYDLVCGYKPSLNRELFKLNEKDLICSKCYDLLEDNQLNLFKSMEDN